MYSKAQEGAQEVCSVSSGCYLNGEEGEKGVFNALLFCVHHKAERPSMLVVLALVPLGREEFYTSSVAA